MFPSNQIDNLQLELSVIEKGILIVLASKVVFTEPSSKPYSSWYNEAMDKKVSFPPARERFVFALLSPIF